MPSRSSPSAPSAGPSRPTPEAAARLADRGIEREEQGDLRGACSDYTAALDLYWELTAANPEAYQEPMGILLNQLGMVRQELGELTGARDCYLEARTLFQKLARTRPDPCRMDLVMTLLSLGPLYDELGDLEAARDVLEEALREAEALGDADIVTQITDYLAEME